MRPESLGHTRCLLVSWAPPRGCGGHPEVQHTAGHPGHQGPADSCSQRQLTPVLVCSLLKNRSSLLPKGWHWAPHEGDCDSQMIGDVFVPKPAKIGPETSCLQNTRSEESSHSTHSIT